MKLAIATLVVVALTFGGAAAEHCAGPSTTTPILTLHWVGGNGLYVTGEASCALADAMMCVYAVYEEANGMAGLQRADEVVDDTCHGMIAGDHRLV